MVSDVIVGALIGAVIGGIVGGLFYWYGKRMGRTPGKRSAPPPGGQLVRPESPIWKTAIRRVILGVIWFLVIWFAARIVCGAVVGGIAGGRAGAGGGFAAGQIAALAFFQHYGLLLMLGSLTLAVLGTATGILPGTAVPGRKGVAPVPPPEGQWPPAPKDPGAA